MKQVRRQVQSAAPKAEHPAPLGCVTHTGTSWTRVHVTDLTCQLQSLTDCLQAPEQFMRALPTFGWGWRADCKTGEAVQLGSRPLFFSGSPCYQFTQCWEDALGKMAARNRLTIVEQFDYVCPCCLIWAVLGKKDRQRSGRDALAKVLHGGGNFPSWSSHWGREWAVSRCRQHACYTWLAAHSPSVWLYVEEG